MAPTILPAAVKQPGLNLRGAIVELAGNRLAKSPEIVPIATADYPTAAVRAADTRLNCTAITGTFGIKPRPWRVALAETIDRLMTQKDIP